MKPKRTMERRQFLKGTLGAASLVALTGCDNLSQSSWLPSILNKTEQLTLRRTFKGDVLQGRSE